MAHFLSDRKTQAVSYAGRTSPQCRLSLVCRRVRSSDLFFLFFIRQMSSELPWDVEFESTYMLTTPRSTSVAPPRIVTTRCHTSVGLRIGNRILDELKSAETQCLENRIHLDWHSTAGSPRSRKSPDGRSRRW